MLKTKETQKQKRKEIEKNKENNFFLMTKKIK